MFHTAAASGTSVSVSSLQPQNLTPFVGDAVMFSNGDVRQITGVSGSTVTLGEVMWSNKGDPGVSDATLSNIDGNSAINGFTQEATKGIAQAKNYYNLGAFDTYVPNSDGAGTVTRKTRIWIYRAKDVSVQTDSKTGLEVALIDKPKDYKEYDSYSTGNIISNKFYFTYGDLVVGGIYSGYDAKRFAIIFAAGTTLEQAQQAIDGLIIQYELASEYQYTEQVIENQPIRFLPLAGELELYEEWRKGLNLFDHSKFTSTSFPLVDGNYLAYLFIWKGNYEELMGGGQTQRENFVGGVVNIPQDGTYLVQAENHLADTGRQTANIYLKSGTYYIRADLNTNGGTLNYTNIMLSKGTQPYAYEPFNGEIIHENRLPLYITTENTSPAQTIGGDWESLGSFTTSTNQTLYAWRKL